MAALSKVTLLETLGLEGDVTVAKLKDRPFYHVLFRYKKVQYNRSTGESEYTKALVRAAEIFATVVHPSKDDAAKLELKDLVDELKIVKAQFASIASQHPLTPSVDQGSHSEAGGGKPKTLTMAYKKYLAVKKKENSSYHHIDSIRVRIGNFVTYCIDKKVDEVRAVTPHLINDWLQAKGLSPKSFNNYLNYVAGFFSWCVEFPQQWITSNPCDVFRRHRVGRKPIKLLTAAQAAEIMAYIEEAFPLYASFYALALFAGIRQDKIDGELRRLTDAVRRDGWAPYLSANKVEVPDPKVGDARSFPLSENLRKWLQAYPRLKTPKPWYHRVIGKKFKIPYNSMRHTAISAFLCNGGSMTDAILFFGTSETMIKKHYLGKMNDPAAFYRILPKRVPKEAAKPISKAA